MLRAPCWKALPSNLAISFSAFGLLFPRKNFAIVVGTTLTNLGWPITYIRVRTVAKDRATTVPCATPSAFLLFVIARTSPSLYKYDMVYIARFRMYQYDMVYIVRFHMYKYGMIYDCTLPALRSRDLTSQITVSQCTLTVP